MRSNPSGLGWRLGKVDCNLPKLILPSVEAAVLKISGFECGVGNRSLLEAR